MHPAFRSCRAAFGRSPSLAAHRVAALALVGLAAIASTSRADGGPPPANRRAPNLVLIMADDLGAKELSCYGNKEHRTPTLDRLAETGVRFETCYATPICHSTRFEIMTGQYGCHNGVYHFAGRPGGPRPDSPDEQIVNHVTFAHVLKKAGYATGLAGKWQLSGRVPDLVFEAGFDEYLMWAYKHNLPEGVEHTGGWEGKPGGKTSRYWHPSLLKNGHYVQTGPDDYGPDLFTDFVVDFIARHKDQPFFIYYPMALTHAPYYSTPATNPNQQEKFRHSKEKFKENVEYVDKLIARIIDALEKQGLRDNTVVFFTGDNGTGGQGKGQYTELGARVPMIVNGPGIVKPLGRRMELVDLSDVLPTLAELAGAAVPDDRPIDGRSFAPLLTGKPYRPREWIFSYLGPARILRTGRFLLEKNTMNEFGRLYDCGDSRNGEGYRDVTNSTDREVEAVRRQFEKILAERPSPVIASQEQPKKRGAAPVAPKRKRKANGQGARTRAK